MRFDNASGHHGITITLYPTLPGGLPVRQLAVCAPALRRTGDTLTKLVRVGGPGVVLSLSLPPLFLSVYVAAEWARQIVGSYISIRIYMDINAALYPGIRSKEQTAKYEINPIKGANCKMAHVIVFNCLDHGVS